MPRGPDATLELRSEAPATAETFDEEVEQAAENRSQQRFGWGILIIGVLVAVGGVADLLYTRGQTGLDIGQRFVPWIIMGTGVGFALMILLGRRTIDPIARVTVDDAGIRITTLRGKVKEFAWADPKLTLSLSHAVDERATAEEERAKGWILSADGAGGHVWDTIGPRAGEGLMARAPRVGFQFTRDSTRWTGKYGERNVTIDVEFSRTRPDDT